MAFNVTVHGRTIHRSVMLTWFRASESHFGEIFSLQIALLRCTQDQQTADWAARCISDEMATDSNGNHPRAVLVVQKGSGLAWSVPDGHMFIDKTGKSSLLWPGEGGATVGPANFAVLPAAPVVAD